MGSDSFASRVAALITVLILGAGLVLLWWMPLSVMGDGRHWALFLKDGDRLEAAAPCPWRVEARPPQVKRIVIVGDILLANWMELLFLAKDLTSGDPLYPFGAAAELLRAADISAGNLECPMVSDRRGAFYTIDFAGDPKRLDRLAAAGFDLMTLANNHILNAGPRGLTQTMHHLGERGISHAGAGETAGAAYAPRIIVLDDGVRIGWLGFNTVAESVRQDGTGPVMAMARPDSDRHLAAVRRARAQVDFLVVLMHWGDEYVTRANPAQQRLGRQLADAGADLVVGAHPHRVQGFERYKDALIVYSLGNFAFALNDISDQFARSTSGAILQCDLVAGRLVDFQLIPILEFQGEPVPLLETCRDPALQEARSRLLDILYTSRLAGS